MYNPNPLNRRTDDCSVRALTKALGLSWDEVYLELVSAGFIVKKMPSSKSVVDRVLRQHGFKRRVLSDSCPDCYTMEDFCQDHPSGTFVLAGDDHIVTIVDGRIYDTWDSRDEVPLFYWERET